MPTAHTTLTVNSDYFRLDDDLAPEELAIRDKVRAFAEGRVLPVINDYWEMAEFPYELLPRPGRARHHRHHHPGLRMPRDEPARPPAWWPARWREPTAASTPSSESTRTCAWAHSTCSAATSSDCDGFLRWPASRRRAPSHSPSRTTAPTPWRWRRAPAATGDEWVLNGRKRWIGNGHAADVVVLFARNIDDGQVNAFVVEKDADGAHPAGYVPPSSPARSASARSSRPTSSSRTCACPPPTAWTTATRSATSPASCRPRAAALRGRPSGTPWPLRDRRRLRHRAAVQFGNPIAGYQLVQARLANMLSELTDHAAALQPHG